MQSRWQGKGKNGVDFAEWFWRIANPLVLSYWAMIKWWDQLIKLRWFTTLSWDYSTFFYSFVSNRTFWLLGWFWVSDVMPCYNFFFFWWYSENSVILSSFISLWIMIFMLIIKSAFFPISNCEISSNIFNWIITVIINSYYTFELKTLLVIRNYVVFLIFKI